MINITDSLRAKINSWKTGENIRHTKFGDYYILDEIISEADLISKEGFNPYIIDLYFEVEYKKISIFHITIPTVSVISKVHTIIFFPLYITLGILNKRNLAEILSKNKGLIKNFLDIELAFGVGYGKTLSLGRDSDVIYEFKRLLKRYILDIETMIKLEMDYPVIFEDIEKTENLELREQILREFGYENYIKEGWDKGRILTIITDREILMGPKHKMYNSSLYEESRIKELIKYTKEECIIFMDNEISFLKVQDSSTHKIYFLKVPPDMHSVQEAKAWTFGLEKEEYNSEMET